MGILYKDNTYPLKHWITVLALGPLITFVHALLFNPDFKLSTDIAGIYMMCFVFGLVFSLPVLVLYLLLFNLLIRKTKPALPIKTILNLVAITGVFVTVKLMGGYRSIITVQTISYSIAIIVSSFFYKVED